jgi:hypothetical protein
MRLYAYVDGSDLHDLEVPLCRALADFARTWRSAEALLVNQQHAGEPGLSPGDLPGWDLGLNVSAESLTHSAATELFEFLRHLCVAFGRDFAVGLEQSPAGSEDVGYISASSCDAELHALAANVAQF